MSNNNILTNTSSVAEFQSIHTLTVIVGALALAGFAIIAAATPQVTGYEVYIYNGYPTVLFMLLFVALGCGIISLILSAVGTRRYVPQTIGLILTSYAVFLLLPKMHGYLHYGRARADILMHVGFTRTILKTGMIHGEDLYPATHLLMAFITEIGVPISWLRTVLSLMFTGLWFGGIYVYARRTIGRNRALFVFVAAVPLSLMKFYATVQPAVISFMAVPLAFFLLWRYTSKRDKSYLPALFIICSALIFYHPVTAAILTVMTIIFRGWSWFDARFSQSTWSGTRGRQLRSESAELVGSLILITMLYYYLGTERVQNFLILVAVRIGLGMNPERATAAQNRVSQLNPLTTPQIVERFVELYGTVFTIFGIAGFSILLVIVWVILRRWFNRDIDTRMLRFGLHHTLQFGAGVGIGITFIFVLTAVNNPIRVLRLAIFAAVLLSGLFLAWSFGNIGPRTRTKTAIGVIALLLILTITPLAFMNVYQPNYQMTHTTYEGAEWALDHRNPDERVQALAMTPKLSAYIKGAQYIKSPSHKEAFTRWYPTTRPDRFPQHLGYGTHQYVGDTMTQRYLVTKSHDMNFWKWYFPNQKKTFAYYSPRDVDRLSGDSTANRIYANGGWSLWRLQYYQSLRR